MIEGITKSGFKYKYDERILDDYSLVEAITAFDKSDNKMQQVSALTNIIDLLLGDTKDDLMIHIAANNEGFRPLAAVYNEVFEIISASKDLKNS